MKYFKNSHYSIVSIKTLLIICLPLFQSRSLKSKYPFVRKKIFRSIYFSLTFLVAIFPLLCARCTFRLKISLQKSVFMECIGGIFEALGWFCVRVNFASNETSFFPGSIFLSRSKNISSTLGKLEK